MESREKELLKKLDEEELSALAFGFPLLPESYYENFDNFNNDLASTGTTDDINGDWQPLDSMDSFDGFDFIDDEDFDDFLTKRARQRNKRRRKLRREGRASGMSRKEARRNARKQALEEIPREKLKTIIKRGIKKVGRAIKVGAVAIPRASYLSLIAVNFRGLAYKLSAIIDKKYGNDEAKRQKLKDKWYNLGGKWDKLVKAVNNGKRKKPSICGKRCKKKLADKGYKRGFVNTDELDFDVFNYPTGVEEVGLGVWIGLGSAVIGAMGTITATAITSKTEKKAIEQADNQAKLEAKTLSESEQRAYDLEIKRLEAQADPKTAILNNPNLSEAEKQEALKTLGGAEEKDTQRKILKYALFGALAIGGVFILTKVLKRK